MDQSHRADSKPRPLFASAETISQSIRPESDVHDSPNVNRVNDLENLNLNLARSTLDAILAVQQIPTPGLQISCHESGESSSENDKTVSLALQYKSEDGDDEPYRRASKKRKRSKERHKKKKKNKHKRNLSRSPSPLPERSEPSFADMERRKGKLFIDDIPNMTPESAFQIDRKANKDLRRYESVSKLHVAKYKLACRSCVGNPTIQVDYPVQDSSQKEKKQRWKDSRYFGKENVKLTRKRGYAYHSDLDLCKIAHLPEFINLPVDGDEKKHISIGSYSCLDEATSLYVQGKGKLPSATEVGDDYVMDDIFEKIAQFNQRTREEPNNVDLWLEFVNFQDVVAMEDKSFKKQTLHLYDVYRPSKSVIEKKLAIIEKAVELNPSSLQLKEAQLELYQDIWEPDKVERAWEDLLFVHSSNIDLWRHYLSRQQSQLRTFSFTKVLKKYQKCFRTLVPILEGQVEVIKKSDYLEEKLLDLFHQYCSFLHQSGYTERAVTSFQAMVEMNLFCPSELNLSSTKDRLTRFESFWESPAPKFGDLNAKGWAEWEKNKEARNKDVGCLPVSTEEIEDVILAAAFPKSLAWLKMEKFRCNVYWVPWRPDESKGETEDNCEDPDRLILFEDISSALFRLRESHSCIQLVCLFLSFLGLNSDKIEKIVNGINTNQKSRFDGYMLNELHQIQSSSFMNIKFDVGSMWMPHTSLVDTVKNVILQAESYFSLRNREIFTLLRFDIDLQKNGVSNVQALPPASCKEIKKLGKNLLKESQNRNNLVIWDAYIRLLWVLSDKMEETVSMVDTALGMFTGSNSLSDPRKAKGICLLCRTFAEIMLNFEPLEYVVIKGRHTSPIKDDKSQVIGCMGALFEGSKFKPHSKVDSSSPYILRVRKRAMKILETLMSDLENSLDSTSDALVAFTQCYVLFEYCASNFKSSNQIFIDVQSQIKVILSKNLSNSMEVKNFLKDLYISQISFISNVMHIESIPLLHMRETLGKALSDFPECGYFHKAFLEVEYGSFLAGRVRKFYDKQLKCSPSVPNVVFAVLSELSRLEKLCQGEDSQSDTGLVNRIRSLFEHSLEIPVCTHCPLLWRMWLSFEIKHGTMTRAKGILYRALQSCPWAKLIYMDGVEYFGGEELQEMSDLMTEKEIRVCMPLEEVDLLLNAEKDSNGEEHPSDNNDGATGVVD